MVKKPTRLDKKKRIKAVSVVLWNMMVLLRTDPVWAVGPLGLVVGSNNQLLRVRHYTCFKP